MYPVPEETLKSHFVNLFLTSRPPWLCVFWVLSNLWRQPARTKRSSKICWLANLWLRSFQLPLLGCREKLSTLDVMSTLYVRSGQFRPELPMKNTFSHQNVLPRHRDLLSGVSDHLQILKIYANSCWPNRISKCNSETNYKQPNASAMQIWLCVRLFLFCFVRFFHSTVVWNKRTDS